MRVHHQIAKSARAKQRVRVERLSPREKTVFRVSLSALIQSRPEQNRIQVLFVALFWFLQKIRVL
jgi:hypothetical protein